MKKETYTVRPEGQTACVDGLTRLEAIHQYSFAKNIFNNSYVMLIRESDGMILNPIAFTTGIDEPL